MPRTAPRTSTITPEYNPRFNSAENSTEKFSGKIYLPLTKLNADQLRAATAPFGHNLIIASAGTGKTSTIVGRIAHLLQSGKKP